MTAEKLLIFLVIAVIFSAVVWWLGKDKPQ